MTVIDIKQRLIEKVKKDLGTSGSEEGIQRSLNELQETTGAAGSVEKVRELLGQVLELLSDGLTDLRMASQLADENDDKSLATLYVTGMIQAGNLYACSEALRMLMGQISNLEPELIDEHFLMMIDKIRNP
jgi:NDP-sugar pyrophosphorylase family protein